MPVHPSKKGAWRKAPLKPTRRGRNTKTPSSAPQVASPKTISRSNPFLAIQQRRSMSKEAQVRHSQLHSASPRAFHNHLNTFWKQQLIIMGVCFQQRKEETSIVSLLLRGLPKQAFISSHFIARIQFPLLSPLVP